MLNSLLVVDDEVSICQNLKRYFGEKEFNVKVVHDGKSGIEISQRVPLDLVLLDLGLPDISGLDVLKIIKTTSPSTGVIIITAYGDVETTVKATQMKGDDFVLKPIDLAALGTILTGMGDDGAEGIRAMKRRGGIILAQNEETCVVYGMPKAAYLSGCVDRMVPLNCVAREIDEFR